MANFIGTIPLLSKKEEAVHIVQFRPICLLNMLVLKFSPKWAQIIVHRLRIMWLS